jgi:ribonuclease D
MSDLLTTGAEISDLAQELSQHDTISFDTEFIRENTFFPIVEILQVATESKSWLVDVQAFKGNKQALKPLLDVFTDPKILKIVHAAQGDQECLYTAFGVTASPSLDTAIAASLCGYGDGVGLGNLLKTVLGVTIKKGHARTNWSVRPLPKQLLEYAHADVTHLVKLGRTLLAELDKRGRREWALENTSQYEVHALYEPDPEGMALKVARGGRIDPRAYAALIDLMKWREDRVRQVNVPRRWIADDQVLIDLAQVRPKDIDHLSTFRGLNKGEIKVSGEKIVSILNRASEAPSDQLPKLPHRQGQEAPNSAEAQMMDLLKCYVSILAAKHQVAMRHLLSTNFLLPLLRTQAKTPDDLVKEGLLTPSAARLIGEEILALLEGRRALSITKKSGRSAGVTVVEIS